MKRVLQLVILAAFLLLPLSLSAQNKGFQLPSKKQSTTKSSGNKSSNSPKSNKQSSHSSNQAKRSPNSRHQIPEVIQLLIDNMVYVEGGTFIMGATYEQISDATIVEKPTHPVTLSSFFIGKFEVTQAQWQVVMNSNPSYFKGSNLPVEMVSWDDCQEFIRRLNAMTNRHFRLPTEAEWEYAARGGNKSQGFKYAGSNTLSSVAWYDVNSGSSTHAVGTKLSNELGIFDMSGNVWEWCQDWYGSYDETTQYNPIGPVSGSTCIRRGGCWGSTARRCRVSERSSNKPSSISSDLGFRLVL